ncbi:uncharacterized protein BcabD6B2_14150 [Babesia caballi]|uniref:Uncharacterized protein n=1 Tax=Babesia caballi TaxID=5871 RepID=A0AAV4LR53_BABCB|nr:hypothetical protein BcabD6B2_14150 [Babesia caballi]
MKLPFLLNNAARAASASEVESVFSKLLKVLPQLEGAQVSNILNLLSKKDVKQRQGAWTSVSKLLLAAGRLQSNREGRCPDVDVHDHVAAYDHARFGQRDTRSMAAKPSAAVKCRGGSAGCGHDTRSEDGGSNLSLLATYDTRDVVIILNAFSKVDIMPPELIGAVVEIVKRHLNQIGAHELSKTLHTLGKHGLVGDVNAVLKGSSQGFDEGKMDEKDYSMILQTLMLNKHELKDASVLDRLVGIIDRKCEGMSDKSMAILVNSLGRFGKDERNILPLIVPLIVKRMESESFDPMCVAQVANGIARLKVVNRELMATIAKRTCDAKDSFSTRCKVTVLNAFHKLDVYDAELLEVMVANLTSAHSDMTPQCIANTIAAVAHFSGRMRLEGITRLFEALCRSLSEFESLRSFTMQNQVNILNGLSKVGVVYGEVFKRIGDNMLNTKTQIKAIDAAMILNAFSRVKMTHPVVTHLCRNLPGYLHEMKPQELTCCINSVNQIRKFTFSAQNQAEECPYMKALNTLASHLVSDSSVIPRFRPLDVRLAIVNLVDCGIGDRPLYARLLQHLEAQVHRASLWDLVCIFSAMAKTGHVVEASLLDAVEASLEQIGACKDRAQSDAGKLRNAMDQMGLKHPLSDKLARYA